MYKAELKKNGVVELECKGELFFVNGKALRIKIVDLEKNQYNITYKNKVYNATLVDKNIHNKELTLKISGKNIVLTLRTELDDLLGKFGLNKNQSSALSELKAPMPGLVVDIKVQEGQSIMKGEPLLILEAMKMENVIKAQSDVKIQSILVKQGEGVEKNQILIKF